MKEYDDLLFIVGRLTQDEAQNLQQAATRQKDKILENINTLGFYKRELEKKILKEYAKLDSIDKHIVGVFY